MFGATVARDLVATHIPIYQFEKGRSKNVLSVSHLEGFYVHFDGRSRVCPGASNCPLCSAGRQRRYLGWFAGIVDEQRVLIRLTAEAALRLTAYPPAPGYVYKIESQGSRKPLQIAFITEDKTDGTPIMEKKELVSILMAIHGLGIASTKLTYEETLQLAEERATKQLAAESFL